MPQSGTGVSVEAGVVVMRIMIIQCYANYLHVNCFSFSIVDPVFQQQFLDMLKQTGRPEMVCIIHMNI